MYIELSGSPFPLTRQKPGGIYALNCGGPAYQDMNDIVYSSEHKQFASFTYDFACGKLMNKKSLKTPNKVVIRSRKSNDRQHIGQKKKGEKDKQ